MNDITKSPYTHFRCTYFAVLAKLLANLEDVKNNSSET